MGVLPHRDIDPVRIREIKQLLIAEIESATDKLRIASTNAEEQQAQDAYDRALQRFVNLAKGIMPDEFCQK